MNSSNSSKLVLVIDDEPTISLFIRLILEEAGYRVVLAGSEAELSEVLDGHRSSIDVVLCDIMLPWLSGPEIVQQLRQTRPQLPAILMSGLIEQPLDELSRLVGNVEFLPKPFTPATIKMTVERTLQSHLHGSEVAA